MFFQNRFFLLLIILFLTGCSFSESYILGHVRQSISEVTPPLPPTISYLSSTFKAFNQEPITPLTPTTSGAALSFSINPTLPAGLSFNSSTGVISGTASIVSPATVYTITVTDANDLSASTQMTLSSNPVFLVDTAVDAADAVPGDFICATAGNACSLRAAIEESNSLNVHCKIYVPDGTYLFSNTQLAITTDLSIVGTSRAGTILDGNNTKRILDSTAAILELSRLTLQNGNGDDNAGVKRFGGALRHSHVAGQLLLQNVAVINNQTLFVGTSYGGGGIYFSGDSATIEDSLFSGNQTDLLGAGSGSSSGAGAKIITRIASVTRTTFSNNTVDFTGGGIAIWATGNVSLTDSTFTGNTTIAGGGAGGGAYVTTNGTSSYFSGNTFISNSADKGGGLQIDWAAGGKIENNTFYGNTATVWWGGGLLIQNNGAVPYQVYNNTFTNNSAASSGGNFGCIVCFAQIANNIMSASGGGGNCGYLASNVTSLGGNIEDANTCSFGMNDLINTNPLLVAGVPQSNGGVTQTILLQGGSPAINFGVLNSCPAVDQRHTSRTGGVCSSGSTQQ